MKKYLGNKPIKFQDFKLKYLNKSHPLNFKYYNITFNVNNIEFQLPNQFNILKSRSKLEL